MQLVGNGCAGRLVLNSCSPDPDLPFLGDREGGSGGGGLGGGGWGGAIPFGVEAYDSPAFSMSAEPAAIALLSYVLLCLSAWPSRGLAAFALQWIFSRWRHWRRCCKICGQATPGKSRLFARTFQVSHQRKEFTRHIDDVTTSRQLSKVCGTQAIDREWLALKTWLPNQLHRKAVTPQGSDVNVHLNQRTYQFIWRRSLGVVSPNAFLGALAAELRKK